MNSQRFIFTPAEKAKQFAETARQLWELWLPKEPLTIWQWADRYRFLAKGVSNKSLDGAARYSSAEAPHQREPQEAVRDKNVQIMALVMASQIGGKTEMMLNIMGYHMHWEPRQQIIMYPQLDASEKFSKKKFTPNCDASPVLRALLRPARERDSGNTILVKEFKGGSIFFVGANSAPSLRGASGAVLMADEIDSNRASAGMEGDPIELLWKRGEVFPNCVKVLASTPTLGGRDDQGVSLSPIWAWFELSDQRYWFVPCARCNHWQTLEWSQVEWAKNRPETAVIVCKQCAAALDDTDRLAMYFAGEWRPTAAFNGVRGYHLNGLYCPWPAQKGFKNRLHQFAVEHLRALKQGVEAMRVRTNTFFCLCFDEGVEEIDYGKLFDRGEDYGPQSVPTQVIAVIAAVDVQKDRLEVEAIGIGLNDETWGIEKRELFGDTEQDLVWEDLAELLGSKYKRRDGVELPISATAIDMRHRSHRVVRFVRKSGIARVFPMYGVGDNSPMLVRSNVNKHYRLRVWSVNSKLAKDIVFARIRTEAPGPRYTHWPKGHGYTEDYFSQLTAERLQRTKVKGSVVEQYVKIRARNEALDIRVYALALVDAFPMNLTAIAKRQKPPEEPPTGENKPEPVQPPPPAPKAKAPFVPRMPSGFVRGWRR